MNPLDLVRSRVDKMIADPENDSLKQEAYAIGARKPPAMYFEDRGSQEFFKNEVRRGKLTPSKEDWKKVPLNLLWECLATVSDRKTVFNEDAEAELEDRVDEASNTLDATAWQTMASFINNELCRGYGLATYDIRAIRLLKPAFTRLNIKMWRDLKRRWERLSIEELKVEYADLVKEVDHLRRRHGALAAAKTRGPKGSVIKKIEEDVLLQAIKSGDVYRVKRFDLENLDKDRFEKVKDVWLKSKPEMVVMMFDVPKEYYMPYRKELMEAYIKCRSVYPLRNHTPKMTCEEWRQLSPDLQYAVLVRAASLNNVISGKTPSLKEMLNLHMLYKMGSLTLPEGCDEDLLDQAFVVMRMADNAKCLDIKTLSKSAKVEDFVSVLGEDGKNVYLLVKGMKEKPSDLLEIIEKFPGRVRDEVFGLSARLLCAVTYSVRNAINSLLGENC